MSIIVVTHEKPEPVKAESRRPRVRVVNTFDSAVDGPTASLEVMFPRGTEQSDILAWLKVMLGDDIPDSCEELC